MVGRNSADFDDSGVDVDEVQVDVYCNEDEQTERRHTVPSSTTDDPTIKKLPRNERSDALAMPTKRRKLSDEPARTPKTPRSVSPEISPVLRAPKVDRRARMHAPLLWTLADPVYTTDKERSKLFVEMTHAGFDTYESNIYLHRRSLENAYHPIACLSNQPQLTPVMRCLLVDWLSRVHRQFEVGQDTLFLTVNIIDRFLITTPVHKDAFQLLGITALLISAKQNEVFVPEISELLKLCCGTYTREQVQQLELIVLTRIHFDLLAPTSEFFLEHHGAARVRSASLGGYTLDQARRSLALARHLLELGLQDYAICQIVPSVQALAALEVADEMHNHSTRMGALYCGGYSPEVVSRSCDKFRMLSTRIKDFDLIYDQYVDVFKLEDFWS